jgi:hypothetical protein
MPNLFEKKPYGLCPKCKAKGVYRERRPNGNDKCENGHTYPSKTARKPLIADSRNAGEVV